MLLYRHIIRKSEPKQQVSYSTLDSSELSENKGLVFS